MSATRGIENWQLKKMFGIAKSIGMDDDDLRALANADSLKLLSYLEASRVIKRLEGLQGTDKPGKKTKCGESGKTSVPGMMTAAQQRKAWYLMYQLKSYDETISAASLGDRLCGIINKELKINATAKEPYKWIDFKNGRKLIEILKKYVLSVSKGSANEKNSIDEKGCID